MYSAAPNRVHGLEHRVLCMAARALAVCHRFFIQERLASLGGFEQVNKNARHIWAVKQDMFGLSKQNETKDGSDQQAA